MDTIKYFIAIMLLSAGLWALENADILQHNDDYTVEVYRADRYRDLSYHSFSVPDLIFCVEEGEIILIDEIPYISKGERIIHLEGYKTRKWINGKIYAIELKGNNPTISSAEKNARVIYISGYRYFSDKLIDCIKSLHSDNIFLIIEDFKGVIPELQKLLNIRYKVIGLTLEFQCEGAGEYIQNFRKLRFLDLGWHSDSTIIQSISTLDSLEVLNLEGLGRRSSPEILEPLGRLNNLRTIYLSGYEELEGLSYLKDSHLKRLYICSIERQHFHWQDLVQYLTDLKCLDFGHNKFMDNDLVYLINLNNLRYINLALWHGGWGDEYPYPTKTRITGEGIKFLANIDSLKALNISGIRPVFGLNSLMTINSLEYLNLDYTTLYEDEIGYIARMKNIKWLDLGNTKLNDEDIKKLKIMEIHNDSGGIDTLSALQKLKWLDLSSTKITDYGLQQLNTFSGLEGLDISHNEKITNYGIKFVAEIKTLKWLNLYGLQIDNDCIQYLKRLKKLVGLDLTGTQLSRKGLMQLKTLSNLRWLRLCNFPFFMADLPDTFKKYIPKCDVIYW